MMLNSDTDSEYTESAYGASSDSGSSEEKRKSREREHKKTKKATAREKKKKEKAKDDEPKKNTCPHCKKYHRKKPHRVEPDKCMWNKKYKGYRFKLICDDAGFDAGEGEQAQGVVGGAGVVEFAEGGVDGELLWGERGKDGVHGWLLCESVDPVFSRAGGS